MLSIYCFARIKTKVHKAFLYILYIGAIPDDSIAENKDISDGFIISAPFSTLLRTAFVAVCKRGYFLKVID